jgi:hypothetical protein
MDDLDKMEDAMNQASAELSDLRIKALDTQFTQEAFQNNQDKTKFYTGLPNFLVLMKCFNYVSHTSPVALGLHSPHLNSSFWLYLD